MKSQYARTATHDGIDIDDHRFQDMTTSLEQNHADHTRRREELSSSKKSGQKSFFHSHVTRNLYIAVLLVAFATAGIIGYVYHHSATTNALQTNSDNSEDNGEQMIQLRSSSVQKQRNSPEIIGHMYVFIRQSLDSVHQAPLQRLRIPVARYTRRHFPLKGPFISLMPHVPIVADRKSKQTIIRSRRNGLYLLPSLRNKLRERFSIAELILAGYASLSSNGARPNKFIDMTSLFLSQTLTGLGIPRFNPLQGGFTSSMRTRYGSFKIPEYREILLDLDEVIESDEEEDDNRYSSEQYETPMQHKYYRKKPNHVKYPVTMKTMTTAVNKYILTTAVNERSVETVDKGAYFQLSYSNNQLGQSSAKSVQYNMADEINDYTIFKNGTVVYKNTGIFFAMHAIQVGSPRGNGRGQIHLWSRRNEQDELNSNSIYSVEAGSTAVLIYPAVFESHKYDTAILMFSAIKSSPCSTLGLIATDFTNEPVVPSIISSEIQISNLIDPVRYATLTSSQTQLDALTPIPVTLNDQGNIRGVGTTNSAVDGSIEFTESKLYFVIAAGQVGRKLNLNTDGFVDLWLRLNGDDVSNSNTRQSVRGDSTAVLVTQSIINVKAGDKLQIMFTSSNNNLGLIATKPTGEPAVPSMIFVTFALDAHKKTLPYAQLSSSKSQWGCSTPTTVNLENDDGSEAITMENGVIKVHESGTYLVIAAGQVGSLDGEGKGDVHLWMQLNGKDMANSNTIQSIIDTDTAVLISQTVVVLRSGDKLQVLFSTDAITGTLGLVAIQPTNEPLIPSIIFTAFRVKL